MMHTVFHFYIVNYKTETFNGYFTISSKNTGKMLYDEIKEKLKEETYDDPYSIIVNDLGPNDE